MIDLPSVEYTGEFQRVASLPRRVWNDADLAYLASSLTEILRTPPSTPCAPVAGNAAARARLGLCPKCGQPLALKPLQALALHDAGIERGGFDPMGVGEGKTLVTLLLPLVFEAERPLLLLPGGLVEKTQRERLVLSAHWRLPTDLRVFSYDMLGRVESVDELKTYAPDLIICDEAHRLKNKRAAVTRRVARYMHDQPSTSFVALSGSFMDKSVREFAHILCWALKWGAPIPTSPDEIDQWSEALDHGIDPYSRRRAGALLSMCTPEERAAPVPEVTKARMAFRRRLIETPGVVATVGEGERVDCSIQVRGIRHKVKPITEWNFLHLRGDGKGVGSEHSGWQTPDDWDLMSGVDVWRHANELALGLFYVWNPRPPIAWMQARQAWGKFSRETISRGRTYDSELHVSQAVDAGKLPHGEAILAQWRALEPTFTPNVEAVWCDDSALEACRDWMKAQGKAGGIVWTEHGFFAARLAEYTGAPYFGAGGFSADGTYIEDAPAGSAVIASIDANREGKNLQKLWSRNLLVCPPKSGAWIEQTIARTHRPGQEADEVTVDILLGCRENFDAVMNAIAASHAVHEVTGKKPKLLLADVTLPSEQEIDLLRSPRWVR